MGMISHVYIKDGKVIDECSNDWYYYDQNSNDITGVEDPVGGNNAIHINPTQHFLLSDKFANGNDSNFVSVDFYAKLISLSSYGYWYFYSLGTKDSGLNSISFCWYDGYLGTYTVGVGPYDITVAKILKISSDELVNKWIHFRFSMDIANHICKLELNGKVYSVTGITNITIPNAAFSKYSSYIGTWPNLNGWGAGYHTNTTTSDFYDFKIYNVDIIKSAKDNMKIY